MSVLVSAKVNISANSMICALNRTVGIDVSYSKMFFSRLYSEGIFHIECTILQNSDCKIVYIFKLVYISAFENYIH